MEKELVAIVLGIRDRLTNHFGIDFSMSKKNKTKYQIRNGQLFYDGSPTKITVNDDYFFFRK